MVQGVAGAGLRGRCGAVQRRLCGKDFCELNDGSGSNAVYRRSLGRHRRQPAQERTPECMGKGCYFAIGISELHPSMATRHFPSVPRRKMLMPLPLSVVTAPVFLSTSVDLYS